MGCPWPLGVDTKSIQTRLPDFSCLMPSLLPEHVKCVSTSGPLHLLSLLLRVLFSLMPTLLTPQVILPLRPSPTCTSHAAPLTLNLVLFCFLKYFLISKIVYLSMCLLFVFFLPLVCELWGSKLCFHSLLCPCA